MIVFLARQRANSEAVEPARAPVESPQRMPGEQEQNEQKEKDDDAEAGKGQGLAGSIGIEEADAGSIEGLESAEGEGNQQHSSTEKEYCSAARVAFEGHGGIIEGARGTEGLSTQCRST